MIRRAFARVLYRNWGCPSSSSLAYWLRGREGWLCETNSGAGLARAAECMELADEDPVHREHSTKIAEKWLELAREANELLARSLT